VTSLRFFPSSAVLLISTTTYELRVVSATDLTTPRKFLGHKREITDTAIVARGRNVLSCAKDGTLRLWDVGGATTIRTMGVQGFCPILKMSLGELGDEWIRRPPEGDEVHTPLALDQKEVDTSQKLVFCALADGTFEAIDLGSKISVYHSSTPGSALNAITYSASHSLLATGSRDGNISVYDTRQLPSSSSSTAKGPLFSFCRNNAAIEDLIFANTDSSSYDPAVSLITATFDGLPFCATISPEGPSVVEEYVGHDCDPVRVVRCAGGSVWTAGDDGAVRKY